MDLEAVAKNWPMAVYQIALERRHFSCGFIDNEPGRRTERAIRAWQLTRHLPDTGQLDTETRMALGEIPQPLAIYTLRAEDFAHVIPPLTTWREKGAATRLDYYDIWELLGEKFHAAVGFLRQLNPNVTPEIGTELVVPHLQPSVPLTKASRVEVSLSERTIRALDAEGNILAHFPCSIAADKQKRPSGNLVVKVVAPHPNYTFDTAAHPDVAEREGLRGKLILPPGPNNPVGTVWIGLSLPTYGIHGTPNPEEISATGSAGCFRLANWNVEVLLKMIKIGTPVDVVP